MELAITKFIDLLFENFDLCFMLIVNIVTYFVIKVIDALNGNKPVSILTKRLSLVIVAIVITICYGIAGEFNNQLINSAVLAPVAYSWIFRPILIKLGIGYKQLDDYLLMKDCDTGESE